MQLVDLLWPIMLLLGLERVQIAPGRTAFTPLDFTHYPITHSLVAGLGWGLLLGVAYLVTRRSPLGAWVVGVGVLSHWFLDLIVHRPDLPLTPWGAARAGLGLWNPVPGTLAVEIGLYVVGAAIYLGTTRARDRSGHYGLWALLAVLLVLYLTSAFGGWAPPGETAVAVAGLGLWLFVPWAYWVDAHRTSAG